MFNWNWFYNLRFWLIMILVLIGISWYWLPLVIPLYYSRALPEDRLASAYELLILPLFIFVIYLLSEILISNLALKNKDMTSLIKGTIVWICFLTFFILFRIIYLVI